MSSAANTDSSVKPPLTLRVLCVDDNADDADYLNYLLSRISEWDVDFRHATEGSEARDLLGSSPIDLLFLDYQLGAETGLDILRSIREADDIRAVIVLTGQGDENLAAEVTRAGADDYVIKGDVGPTELRRTVRYALAKYEKRRYERELAIQAAKLREVNEQLQELDVLKTKFLSEISHELRTPLASMISAARIVQKHFEKQPETVPRFTSTIIAEGARLSRLINDFLDLAKIESGRGEWRDAPLDTANLLQDAVGSVQRKAQERRITVKTETVGEAPLIIADADRLSQVLGNLLSNALKFTPDDGAIVAGTACTEDAVVFSVRDSGAGIAPENLEVIFDRFHQFGLKDRPESGGTGLGLSICKEIVEHYDGRIWVESTPGEGATFLFSLPLALSA